MMSGLDLCFGGLTLFAATVSLTVAIRLLLRIHKGEAKRNRIILMFCGSATLFVQCLIRIFDFVDNLIIHPELPVIASAWLTSVSGMAVAVWFEIFGRDVASRTAIETKLEFLATTDPLTGILNRCAWMDRCEAAITQATHLRTPFALLLLDIDHFKNINDSNGHEAGDQLLCLFGSAIARELREADLFGRLGGEEFGVFLPAASPEIACAAAERIRCAVDQSKLEYQGRTLSVTVSIGGVVGIYPLDDAIRHADAALYKAKRDGRNQVSFTQFATQ
jgi:diguanylate cyclase (GGDEF)-like protein